MFDFNKFKLNLDPAVIAEQARQQHEVAKSLFNNNTRFIGSSLGSWLVEAEAAGIAHIPASQIFSMPRGVFLNQESGTEEESKIWADLDRAINATPNDHMVRWDPCASIELKTKMEQAKLFANLNTLEMGDIRAFEIIMEYPADAIPVWSRPWHNAQYEGNYPIEFRVFVRDNNIEGISNYYIQRPLPEEQHIYSSVKACAVAADKLVKSMRERNRQPWMPSFEGRFDPAKIHASLDFLICKETGQALFLEAGPPFGAGAHPCAFIGRSQIYGLALGVEPACQANFPAAQHFTV